MELLETWLPIPGHEGLYEVSSHGRVRSVDRTIQTSKGLRSFKGKIIVPCKAGSMGYLMVRLSWPNRQKRYVHALVAEAFVGPRPAGMDCRHLDGNHLNNTPANLAWGTRSENMEDARRHGTLLTGDRVPWRKRQRNLLGQWA